MFDIVIHNAKLYPMSESIKQSDMTQIGIKDGIIQQLGNEQNEPVFAGKTVIDAQQACLLPGFIDCHTHIVYASDRADEHTLRLQGVSYSEIHAQGGGIQSSVRAVRETSKDRLVEQSLPRIYNLMSEGVTSLEIKSGYGLDTHNEIKMLEAIVDCRERLDLDVVSTFLGAHTVPDGMSKSDYMNLVVKKMLPEISTRQLADFVDIYVEHIAFDNQDMSRLFEAAKKYGLKTRVHAEQLSNQHAAQTAAQLKAYSADHLEFLDESGAQAMGEQGTVAVLLPSAFYFLRETEKPPISLLRKHNVAIAVASDCNPGTSPIPSILTALHFAIHLFDLTPEEALLGITLNAARALGLEHKKGSLEVGKDADLCFWNIKSPKQLCYQLGGLKPVHRLHRGKMTDTTLLQNNYKTTL